MCEHSTPVRGGTVTRVGRVAVVSGVCPRCRRFYARSATPPGSRPWWRWLVGHWTLLPAVLVVALLTGCQPPPDTVWVVESVGYHGPRGAGQYYLFCVPEGDRCPPGGEVYPGDRGGA